MYPMSFSSLRALLFNRFSLLPDKLLHWHAPSVSNVILSPVFLSNGSIQRSTTVWSGLIGVLRIWIDQQLFICNPASLSLISLLPH
jgi:hypothetical protein